MGKVCRREIQFQRRDDLLGHLQCDRPHTNCRLKGLHAFTRGEENEVEACPGNSSYRRRLRAGVAVRSRTFDRSRTSKAGGADRHKCHRTGSPSSSLARTPLARSPHLEASPPLLSPLPLAIPVSLRCIRSGMGFSPWLGSRVSCRNWMVASRLKARAGRPIVSRLFCHSAAERVPVITSCRRHHPYWRTWP